MANTIKIKNSGTAANIPAALEHGELAINYADGKIFYKNNSNTIVEFGGGGGASSLDELSDVSIVNKASGQVLEYNGSLWVNSNTVRDNQVKFLMEVL